MVRMQRVQKVAGGTLHNCIGASDGGWSSTYVLLFARALGNAACEAAGSAVDLLDPQILALAVGGKNHNRMLAMELAGDMDTMLAG